MRPALILALAAILAVSVVDARLNICSSTADCPTRSQCVRKRCSDKCSSMSDCLPGLGCVLGRCMDVCDGACSVSAKCDVILNEPVCSCPEGQEGDPQELCVAPAQKDAAKTPEP